MDIIDELSGWIVHNLDQRIDESLVYGHHSTDHRFIGLRDFAILELLLSSRCESASRPITITPDVSRSSRWTILAPGNAASALAARQSAFSADPGHG